MKVHFASQNATTPIGDYAHQVFAELKNPHESSEADWNGAMLALDGVSDDQRLYKGPLAA